MAAENLRVLVVTFALNAALASGVRAQDRPAGPVFEVAAIKPHNPDEAGGGFSFQHGRLNISNTVLKVLVMSAYGVEEFQISGGPIWIGSERFDILAQAPDGSDHRDLSPMLQALLADGFKLALHQETRETTVYALGPCQKWTQAPEVRPGHNTRCKSRGRERTGRISDHRSR